jgi:hypothetical protein
LLTIDYRKEDLQTAIAELAGWVRKRIMSSVKVPTAQSLLRIDMKESLEETDQNDIDLIAAADVLEKQITESSQLIHEEKSKDVPSTEEMSQMDPSCLPPIVESNLVLLRGYLTKFGLTTFRAFQLKAINAVERGIDVVVTQRTGSGKSIIYQVPALFDNKKYSIVICPTISLILNQVNQLKEKGIDAIPFGNPAGKDKEANYGKVFTSERDKTRLVYMTP